MSEQIRQGAAGFLSKQVGGFTDTLTGGAVQFDPYNSLRSAIGLAANDRNEQSFKGVQRKFSVYFSVCTNESKEAVDDAKHHPVIPIPLCSRTRPKARLNFLHHMRSDVKFLETHSFKMERSGLMVTHSAEPEALVMSVYGGNVGERKSQVNLLRTLRYPRIGRCFVTSVNVNYTPQAKSSFFVNGVPTEVEMVVTMHTSNQTNKQFILQGF